MNVRRRVNRFLKYLMLAVAFTQLCACGGSDTNWLALTAPVSTTAPTITSANSVTFTEGTAGTFTVTATGSPTPALAVSGTMPAGVTFNTATGVLSGTPAAGSRGTYPLTITASNGTAPNASQNFTLTVHSSFDLITLADIQATTLSSAEIYDIQIPAGTIVVYRTKSTLYGKLLVVSNAYNLVIDCVTYNNDGTVHNQANNVTIHGTWTADLDNCVEVNPPSPTADDFQWQIGLASDPTTWRITPRNGATFAIY